MTYACMSPDELALWRSQRIHGGGENPCVDCPLTFRRAEQAAGRCCRRDTQVRGAVYERGERSKYHNRYATDEERVEARRRSRREWARRKRVS